MPSCSCFHYFVTKSINIASCIVVLKMYINAVIVYYSRSFFKKLIYFIFIHFWLHWVFVAVRGLSLVGGERELLFVAVCGLLNAVASLVAEHGL